MSEQDAAERSLRPCGACPQIRPTGESWQGGDSVRHSPEAVIRCAREIIGGGGDGAYFYNLLPDGWTDGRGERVHESRVLRDLAPRSSNT